MSAVLPSLTSVLAHFARIHFARLTLLSPIARGLRCRQVYEHSTDCGAKAGGHVDAFKAASIGCAYEAA